MCILSFIGLGYFKRRIECAIFSQEFGLQSMSQSNALRVFFPFATFCNVPKESNKNFVSSNTITAVVNCPQLMLLRYTWFAPQNSAQSSDVIESHSEGPSSTYIPLRHHSCLTKFCNTTNQDLCRPINESVFRMHRHYNALAAFSMPTSSPLSLNFTIPPIGPSLQPPMNFPSIQIAGTDVRPMMSAISAR